MTFKLGLRAAALAVVLALAACSTTPPPPPPPPPVAAPKFIPPPTNYRWTNGFSASGFEAMHKMIGRTALRPGEFHWAPSVPVEGDVAITVDIANQIAFVFKGSQLVGVTNISSGKKGHPTPLGFWTINFKRQKYFSRKYDNAPMPWMQNIDDKGIAFHGGKTPGYPASHGCIRLPMAFAKQLFSLTKVGNKVVIEG
ncbi:MAG TPA: L,D-transpeptidase family protein [Sphingomicrobium sp.]|nr:L,D-transpeptidase family protein [Sphingomicrobium sp.]